MRQSRKVGNWLGYFNGIIFIELSRAMEHGMNLLSIIQCVETREYSVYLSYEAYKLTMKGKVGDI